MKFMNEMQHESKSASLKERIIKTVGERLSRVGGDMEKCWFLPLYEPELSAEMIENSLSNQ